jgi:hypothetical protein
VETYGQQFEALGEPIRRQILERLRQGPLPVGELARDEAVGTRRFYRLDRRGFEALRSYFDSFWSEALEAFKAKLEEE